MAYEPKGIVGRIGLINSKRKSLDRDLAICQRRKWAYNEEIKVYNEMINQMSDNEKKLFSLTERKKIV